MRMAVVALIVLAVAGAQGAELLSSDFESLKTRLVGPPSREGYSESLGEQAGTPSTSSFIENGS